jgi:ankyrin repeat protein
MKELIKDSDAIKIAIIHNNFEIIKYLVEHDIPIKYDDLDNAARDENTEIIKYLVKSGVKAPSSVIDTYIENNNLEMVEFLFEHQTKMPSNYYINMVCGNGSIEMVKCLLKYCIVRFGTNVDYFETVCKFGNLKIVKLLLEHPGVFKNLNSGLICAGRNGHLHIIKYLVQNGGKPVFVGSIRNFLEIVKYYTEIGVINKSNIDEIIDRIIEYDTDRGVLNYLECLEF